LTLVTGCAWLVLGWYSYLAGIWLVIWLATVRPRQQERERGET
jgi:hypothetical protein